MGQKMTRAEIDRLNGKKPAPVPVAAPTSKGVEEALDVVAHHLAVNTAVMEQNILLMESQRKANKQLEATIHRDKHGKMERVTITVKAGK